MPEWITALITFLGVFIGSGLIQFFVTRKDNKNDKLAAIEKDLKNGLNNEEERGKARYAEHQEAINKLNDVILKLTENDTKQTQYIKYVGDELMGLAHDRLVDLTDKYQQRGAITLKEIATLEAIYKPYSEGLGGNGDGKAGYEYAMKLPVVTDAVAKEMDLKNKIR